MKALLSIIAMLAAFCNSGIAQADNDRLLKLLATDNHFALMRHALAPGTGDPQNFNVDDCETQRNLNDKGRQQAAMIGGYLATLPDLTFNVYSSQWCRCLETAELLGLGTVTPLPEINSFFENRGSANGQTRATTAWLATATLPAILVTHQVNITALTGVYPSSGEIVVVKREIDGELMAVGSIEL